MKSIKIFNNKVINNNKNWASKSKTVFSKNKYNPIFSCNYSQDLTAKGLLQSDSQLSNVNKKWASIASDKDIEKTKQALLEKNHKVNIVNDEKEALELLKGTIPSGSSIYTAGSTTLDEIGFIQYLIKGNAPYNNLKSAVFAEKDPSKQWEAYRRGFSADYFVSSISALSTQGSFSVVDATTTRIAGFTAGKNVVVVTGANKIVQSDEDLYKRAYEYCFPLESARSRIVFKLPGSSFNNYLQVNNSNFLAPNRVHFIIIKKALGY
eukprot:TRINITY_DN16670_c0_g1_i1.p1 TRINITY_DN16670_c0_g1~~TRINITY_DN16670_c0_g1_i1.p1  ORF type:complete len:265 (-),score=87.28 TRINITY_DN16670_c0_g1_i1:52-846(-)